MVRILRATTKATLWQWSRNIRVRVLSIQSLDDANAQIQKFTGVFVFCNRWVLPCAAQVFQKGADFALRPHSLNNWGDGFVISTCWNVCSL